MKNYSYYIIGILIVGLLTIGKLYNNALNEKQRLQANQTALLQQAKYYRTKDSLSAASVQQLTLANGEFKQYNADLTKQAADLGLKVKRLESASKTATVTVYDSIVTQWRDSVVYVPEAGRTDTIQCMNYRDNYLTFSACQQNGLVKPYIEIRDTLVQFVHRVPHRFLFFRWGTKAIRQDVVTKNPNTRITYTEYIKLK